MKPEKELLQIIEGKCSKNEMLNAAKYLNLNYNIFSKDDQLWNKIKSSFDRKYSEIFDRYSHAIIANKFINELFLKFYPCERTVKYAIVNGLKNRYETVLFEMPVLGSRVDVCRINGNSYAYEIKTEYDTFKRLEKQINDYSKVYEFIYVVIPKTLYGEVIKIIPSYCGVKVFKHSLEAGEMKIFTKKKAIKSPNIDPLSQLSCLSKDNLGLWFHYRNIKKIPFLKEERISSIISKYSQKTINIDFKRVVKQIYKGNWKFILDNYENILPIDVQSFFNNSLDPRLLYMK